MNYNKIEIDLIAQNGNFTAQNAWDASFAGSIMKTITTKNFHNIGPHIFQLY